MPSSVFLGKRERLGFPLTSVFGPARSGTIADSCGRQDNSTLEHTYFDKCLTLLK